MRDKITPKKLNKSADERLVPNTGLIDALNVLITSSEGETGNEGVIKAARGNTEIPYLTSTGAGTAKIIGAVTDQRLKVIYMFLYSSVTAEHGVYVYDPYGNLPEGTAGAVRKVFTSFRFNFDEFGFVKGDVVYVNNRTDDKGDDRHEKDCILYFTDGRSEPKKLNVFRCLLEDAPEGDGPNLVDFITACPKVGLKTLGARFVGDASRSTSNFVNTKGFQFAYQLIYKDGIETAISPYSDIMFPTVIIKQGAQEVVDYTANNVLEIDFDTDIQNRTEIEKIRLLAREGNDGSFFAIDEFKKDQNIIVTYEDNDTVIYNGGDFAEGDATSLIYKFYNDRVVTGVSPNEVAKQYDALPKLAAAQAVINNRLMYGNYVDGFDEQPVSCTSKLIFSERPDDFVSGTIKVTDIVREIPNSNKIGGATTNQFNKTTSYKIDCSGVPNLPENTLINLTIQVLPQQNFHLYNAANSYHQNSTVGDEEHYNFQIYADQYFPNNLNEHAQTYQSPEACGEGFLLGAPNHGNDGNQFFPYFGNNPGVIKGLRWTTVDGPPPSDGENYVGRTFDAVVGTSASNPFIIPASGAGGQLSFSVTLRTIQQENSALNVAQALAAALSGVTNMSQIGLSSFEVVSANIIPTLSVDRPYQNWQRFYDREAIGKLVMGIGKKTTSGSGPSGFEQEGGGTTGVGADAVEQTDGSPIGYALLKKAEVDFMLEQNWGLDLYEGETQNSRNSNPSSGPVAEVRLGVKDISGIELSTCMRRLDTRGLVVNFVEYGESTRRESLIPYNNNGDFGLYDNSPWFIMNQALLSQPSFSLASQQSNLPPAPNPSGGRDSLKRYLEGADDGQYAYLADDINFTLFRHASEEIREASNNVRALSWPNCALNMQSPFQYLGGIDFNDQFVGDYPSSMDPALNSSYLLDAGGTSTIQGFDIETYSNVSGGAVNSRVHLHFRPRKTGEFGFESFACLHSVTPSNNYKFSCGRASINETVGNLPNDGYDNLDLQAEAGQPKPGQSNDDYYQNTRFKFSLLDGAGGPGGFRRIDEGANSIFGSISYMSSAPLLTNDPNPYFVNGVNSDFGAASPTEIGQFGNHDVVMTGVFWNGNIMSADFAGYGLYDVGASTQGELDNLNGAQNTLDGFEPLFQAGYRTGRSQDVFYMPGIHPYPHVIHFGSYRADDIGTTNYTTSGGEPNIWDNPDHYYAYRPLLAYRNINNYSDQDTWFDNGIERFSAGHHKFRVYNRRNGATQAESSSFASIIDGGDPQDRTFKTNAFHDFGIVYYDERGRHGFVNPATSVYVPGYSDTERGGDEDNKGKVSIELDFAGTVAPPWATNYKLVYAPNSTVDFFIQHMSGGAYLASGGGDGGSSVIYVSLNYLQESPISYTSAFGARGPEGELNLYKYRSGDKVRVISYAQTEGRVYPNNVEFDILDVKNFGPSENPLWTGAEMTAPNWLQGQFLVLRNNPLATGFSYESVDQDQDFWSDNCLIEIFSPAKQKSETAVYYEIPDQSYMPAGADYLPFIETNTGKLNPEKPVVIKGDTWWRPNAMNVRRNQTGLEDPVLTNISPSGLVDVIVDTPNGAPAGSNPSKPRFLPVTVESMTASDLLDGNSSFIGRPNAYLPGAKETRREATITYSDFNNPEGTNIKYSSFNYALSNYKDLNEEFGGIDYMMNESGDILVIQNERVSIVPASKTLFSDTAGSSTVVASTNVLGTARTFGLRAGCDGNPESVAVTPENAVFFAHKTLGKIYKYQPGSGVTTISDKNMAAFFRRAFNDALATSTVSGYKDVRVPGGYDPLTKEYLITIPDVPDDVIGGGGDDEQPDQEIFGCTDPDALNYNANATTNDGSCEYQTEQEDCLQIDISYDPGSFSFGTNNLSEDNFDADGNVDVEFQVSVNVTNNGEDVATIQGASLQGLNHPADFNALFYDTPLPTALEGRTIEPGATEQFVILWSPSSLYSIKPGAQLRVDFTNEDGCSTAIDFLPITGSVVSPVDPGDPPVDRFIKVYVQGENPDARPFTSPVGTGDYYGYYYIRYDNETDAAGFPDVGQVHENPVFFAAEYTGPPPSNFISKTLYIQTSGISAEEGARVVLAAAPDGLPMIASQTTPGVTIFGTPEIVLDESILSVTQNEDGTTTGVGALLQTFNISDEILLNQTGSDGFGTASLASNNLWPAGRENTSDWLANDVATGTAQTGGGWLWQQVNDAQIAIDCASDVSTNFQPTNGPAQRPIVYNQELYTTPEYQGVSYAIVRNAPNLIREYCSIPACWQYDPVEGELTGQVPVVGEWTNELYQAFQDFTVNQPAANGLGHPETRKGPAPFKTDTSWYNSSSNVFNLDPDRLYRMQIGYDCEGLYGCTIESACNYNPDATVNDGSCIFPEEGYDCDGNPTGVITGCTNPAADNYNPNATEDDGSCIISGCTNPLASNYNPEANNDDGSCIVQGCTDATALNYDPLATDDDGTCEYDNCPATYPCAMDFNGTGVVTTDEVVGAWAAANNALTLNGYEEGPSWFSFREKYPAFAECSIEQIVEYFSLEELDSFAFAIQFAGFTSGPQGTGQTGIYECEDFDISSPFPTLCELLDTTLDPPEVTLDKIQSVFTGQSSGTYEAGIDFDGDGIVTTNDYNIALELIGYNTTNQFFAPCEDYDPGDNPLGDLPTTGSGNEEDTKDNDSRESKYPKCEDFPEGEVTCGCMDPEADNYDPMAKAHVQSRCSYSENPEKRESRNRRENRSTNY